MIQDYDFRTQHQYQRVYELIEKIDSKIIVNLKWEGIEDWSHTKKSYLIFAILKGLPIPAIYYYDNECGKYYVLSGEKIIQAVWEFYDGKFKMKLPYREFDGKGIKDYPFFKDKVIHGLFLTQMQPTLPDWETIMPLIRGLNSN